MPRDRPRRRAEPLDPLSRVPQRKSRCQAGPPGRSLMAGQDGVGPVGHRATWRPKKLDPTGEAGTPEPAPLGPGRSGSSCPRCSCGGAGWPGVERAMASVVGTSHGAPPSLQEFRVGLSDSRLGLSLLQVLENPGNKQKRGLAHIFVLYPED